MKAALLALAALAAMPASAREVDVARLTPDGFVKDAANLKIAVTAPAAPGPYALTVTAAPATDHETLRLGLYCSAYQVRTPMTAILKLVAAEASLAAGPVLAVSVTGARSMSRCVELKEYNVRCITRVTVTGEATLPALGDAAPGRAPLSVTVERDASVGGFCEDISRGIGVVSREAAQQFLAAAIAAAKNAASPAPAPPPS